MQESLGTNIAQAGERVTSGGLELLTNRSLNAYAGLTGGRQDRPVRSLFVTMLSPLRYKTIQ